MTLGKIKIQSSQNDSPATKFFRVLLDDVDISHFVKYGSLSVDFSNGVPVVRCELIGQVEMPDEIKAVVELYLKELKDES